jgi:hypothetical protein
MAKYRLLSQHYSEDDELLEPGAEVGDGTEHRWTRPPTVEMIALDEEAARLLERERRRVGEKIEPLDELPLTVGENQTQGRRRQKRPAE